MKAAFAIDDALPEDLAEQVRELFRVSEYAKNEGQNVPGRYGSWHRPDLPGKDDVYSARFSRSVKLERDGEMRSLAHRAILPIVREHTGLPLVKAELRAYRLGAGDYFRAHTDEEIAEVGFVYYVSKGWQWDWGGLLMAVVDGDVQAFLPRFNRLAIMTREVPHFVTPVAPYAGEPRYMLAGFCR